MFAGIVEGTEIISGLNRIRASIPSLAHRFCESCQQGFVQACSHT